jgi:hypothetical protein
MTWDEILKASGGKREGKGNNNHHIHRDKFSKRARGRLGELQIYAEQLFSLSGWTVARGCMACAKGPA